jgi:hypothetical protein
MDYTRGGVEKSG